MSSMDSTMAPDAALSAEDEASELFVQRRFGEWDAGAQAALETRLERDAVFAAAYRRMEQSWDALDTHAEAPELMAYRAEAISLVRKANARRWLQSGASRWRAAAAIGAVLVVAGAAWQLSPWGYRSGEYRTGIGEQRIIELEDHSRITLDAVTRLRVRFSGDARTIRLMEGQAQFSVAKDPGRPFKVVAGDRTIVALGTVFTVEYVDRRVHVAMLEGKVAVLRPESAVTSKPATAPTTHDSGASTPDSSASIELSAGAELRVAHDGQTVVTHKADLEAATAWREGKAIFRTETVGEAVRRMNRYSRLQLRIEDADLADKRISGVFEAGDTRGFVDALQRYLPVNADYSQADLVRLTTR